MATEVILPRVDMDMAEGRISRWYVEEGATVAKGQPIFEIETDKAAMEVEAPAAGVIRDLSAELDTALPVGSVVAWIDGEGEVRESGASRVKLVRQAKPGKGGRDDLKPFVGTQRVANPARKRLASHPEASLAWRWGNPPCEA